LSRSIWIFALPTIAPQSLGNLKSTLVVICANGEGVPITFSLGEDGLVVVTSLRLSLRYQLHNDSLYIDEEVFDAATRDLIHTIGQFLVCNGEVKHWLLRPGRYRLCGLTKSVMAASTEVVTPLHFSTCTIQILLPSIVKVEPGAKIITILSDNSDNTSLI
jgi:hypothetical protein